MTLFALLLVVAGAGLHAVWNLVLKRNGGGAAFTWCYSLASAVIYAPLAVWAVATGQGTTSPRAIAFVVTSGVIHIAYALILQTGYRKAGLSIVYPVARGVGPSLSVMGAILFLGERLTWPVAIGATFVAGGVLVIGTARPADGVGTIWRGVGWGALTGIFIAAYTLNDGAAVRLYGVSPIIIEYFGNITRLLVMAPVMLRTPQNIVAEFRRSRRDIVTVGTLMTIPYVLALYAMKLAPISLIAPARELSMLAGVLLAWRVLAEEDVYRRLFGAALIVAGVATLSLG